MQVPEKDVAYWETHTIDEHLSLIKRQLDRSLRDPELRQLALKIVGNKADGELEDGTRYVTAWGEGFRLPDSARCAMRDDWCESVSLWDFVVQNVRYVLDPEGYDLFATAKYTLQAGGGDCDDMVITLGALHRAVGFTNVAARVVSTNGKVWEHVYLLVGYPKSGGGRGSKEWIPFDPTVQGVHPGWQHEGIVTMQDFKL